MHRLLEQRQNEVNRTLQHQVEVCVDNREQSLKRSVLDQLNTQISREIDNRMNYVTVTRPRMPADASSRSSPFISGVFLTLTPFCGAVLCLCFRINSSREETSTV